MIITQPKVPVNVKVRSGTKKFYTLHLTKQQVFTIQKNGTSVVSFRNRNDAIHFGKMLESHYDLTHTWPVIDFEETIFYKHSTKNIMRLKYLETKDWTEDDLREFCIKNGFNVLDIFKFENDHRLVGRSIQWEVPVDYYIDFLNTKLTLE